MTKNYIVFREGSDVMLDMDLIQEGLKDRGIVLSFWGLFTQGIIEEMGEVIRKGLVKSEFMNKQAVAVFSVFIEQTQNIVNYMKKQLECNGESNGFESSGIVAIGQKNDEYFVFSSNWIKNEHVEDLKNKLDDISSKSSDEIKKIYKSQIREARKIDVVGAGLGFLEMGKKSSKPIEYTIDKIDDSYHIFKLTVHV